MSGAPSDHRPETRPPGWMNRAPELAERLLFQEALTVAANAYAPYSGYAVGAVAVGPSGRSHHGANVENAAYPAALCAERAALAALVTHGERELRYVAVAALDGSDCLPCGFCLQALAEFGDPEIVVRVAGDLTVVRLRELLTTPFALPPEEGPDE
jgi:cytidine deaminase